MGTRGIYKFIDQDSAYYVYKHWDNYPSGAAVFIQNTLKLAWKLPRFEADEFSASFIAANKKEGGGVRLMHELEGDKTNIIASLREMWIEYLYEISCKDNKLNAYPKSTCDVTGFAWIQAPRALKNKEFGCEVLFGRAQVSR